MTLTKTVQKKSRALSGWGRYPVQHCDVYRPEKASELPAILLQHTGSLVARGSGRSYGDAALNPEGVVDLARQDFMLGFDRDKGTLTVQAGVLLSDILHVVQPTGWFLHVIPGTKHVTAGGAFACNVHGKNHVKQGNFADHVTEIILRLADGSQATCSPEKNSGLFWSTAGGMGLTGIIESLTLKLRPIQSASLLAEKWRVASLEFMIQAFRDSADSHEYRVAWIDHFAPEKELGRGYFERANHALLLEGGAELGSTPAPQKPRFSVPINAPSWLLNRYSMAAYNKRTFGMLKDQPEKPILTSFEEFFHPLDAIGNWNRLYGKRGFLQYQCVLPDSPDIADRLRELLIWMRQSGIFSFLAVLKQHGASNGALPFAIPGFSLALDFPCTKRVLRLLPQLTDKIIALHGKVYLAKDAVLTADQFHTMYGAEVNQFEQSLKKVNPRARFHSSLARRLKIGEAL